jgi:hypothetical protein
MLPVESRMRCEGYIEINLKIVYLGRLGTIRKKTNLRVVDDSEHEFRTCYYFRCVLLTLMLIMAR